MADNRFYAVPTPNRTEGVGRALQSAYRALNDLPGDWLAMLVRLGRR